MRHWGVVRRIGTDWRRWSRWLLLGTVVMLLWLLAPTVRCSFRAFRDTPLDEIRPDSPGGADQQRIDEGRGFMREWLSHIKSCYDAEPLFGQESWKSTLLCAFAGATVLTWSLARWSRGPKTLT